MLAELSTGPGETLSAIEIPPVVGIEKMTSVQFMHMIANCVKKGLKKLNVQVYNILDKG